MPSPKPYDTTINCGPNNPLCIINRGPVKLKVCKEHLDDPCSDFYVEVRVGKRRARTAMVRYYQQALAMGEVLQILGFLPEAVEIPYEWDEKYD